MSHGRRASLRAPRFARIAAALVVLASAAGPDVLAEVSLLQPARDGTLFEDPSGALASGSGPVLFSGRINAPAQSIRRALLAFDVAAAIPPGSIVTAARLRLNLSATSAGPVLVRLHKVTADWGEGASSTGGGGGAPSAAGDATWIHRFYTGDLWTQAGGDFAPAPSGAATVDQPGPYAWDSTAEMVADVQAWLDDPGQNFGWILLGDETRPQTVKRFDSREHSTEGNRPALEVEYVPPCVPSPLGPGSWRQLCAETGVEEAILACAGATFTDLGLAGVDPCAAIDFAAPRDCQERAIGKLSVLVLNICAARLQTSCPVEPAGEGCESATVGDLLREVAALIREGDCRRASGCAGLSADQASSRR